jgi:hypothetical protein
MAEAMLTAPKPPEPGDFGLSDADIEQVPESRIGSRRVACFLAIYGTAALLVMFAALALSGSLVGALFFGVLLVAAGSVLLVPAVAGLVCALEQCEHSWLCRRHARYRAISEYRKAWAAHDRELARYRAARSRAAESFWRDLGQAALVAETVRALRATRPRDKVAEAGENSGLDAVVRSDSGDVAVRCIADAVASGRPLGREVTAAAIDVGAAEVLVVAPRGADPELVTYLQEHNGRVLAAPDLVRLVNRLRG